MRGFAQSAQLLSGDHFGRLHHACLAQQGTAAYDSGNTKDVFYYLGSIGALVLLLAASVAIWKWAERYRTNMARVADVLMIAGVLVGVSVRMGLILALLGLILMLVARSAFPTANRGT